MSEPSQDHDQNLEKYFDKKKREAIPETITEGYTKNVMQRLQTSKSVWRVLPLPILGCMVGIALIFAFWHLWQQHVVRIPAPSLSAIEIERDAAVLAQVSPADFPLMPDQDILLQIEMLDGFVVAMESKKGQTLSIVEETQILSAVGGEENSGETTLQELEWLDEMEATGNSSQAKRA